MSKEKKVAIIGFSTTTIDLVPWDDESVEKWGLNELYRGVPVEHCSRWFDLHPRKILERGQRTRGPDHLRWLQKSTIPIYMQESFDDIPMAVPYPLQRMIQRFGRYLTSSIAMMLALAIDEDYTEIHIYGVDMLLDSEYALQRPCVEYLIGLARGLGIRVVVPAESSLLKASFIYGYENPPENGAISQNFLKTRIRKQTDLKDSGLSRFLQAEGALKELNLMRQLVCGHQKGGETP